MNIPEEPPLNCILCPRLVAYRTENQATEPGWFNAPVPSFGDSAARLLIVGLAPGVRGANRTGRPFTGDFAGDLLYETLIKFGFAEGTYQARTDDGLVLKNCMITNAVRCVPPKNKPVGEEIRNCRPYLQSRILGLPNLKVILALGRIAHESIASMYGVRKSRVEFSHGGQHVMPDGVTLLDCYHCSRYNTNTGRLTTEMFHEVFRSVTGLIE